MKQMKQNQNPIILLNEKCQRMFGESILTKIVGKTGPDHMPTITVSIETPNEEVFTASGGSQKEAKQAAARIALRAIFP